MKKFIAVMVTFLLFPVLMPYPVNADNGGSDTTFLVFAAVETHGNGYGYPFGTQFYIPMHGGWVIWYYENGSTTARYVMHPEEINGKQVGIAYVMVGIWKSPRLLSQPGEITANMFVLFGVIIKMND